MAWKIFPTGQTMTRTLVLLFILGLGFFSSSAHAQPLPAQPPVPGKFKVLIRYHIPAPRDVHVALYDAMIAHLKKLDFEFDPPLDMRPATDREDRGKNRLAGLVPGKNAIRILDNPSVATVLLIPDGFPLPEDPRQLVQVRLELSGDLPSTMHRELGQQLRPLLQLLDFQESIGYDARGYSGRSFTRLVGNLPVGNLDLLLKDLRNQPTDWFAKVIEREELPLPVRKANPIRVVEVLADPEPTRNPLPPEDRGQPHLDKIAADLWELMQKKDQEDQPVRVQIFLVGTPSAEDKDLRFSLQTAAPSLFIDAILGNVVSASLEPVHARNLARHPLVSVIRLARPINETVDPSTKIPDHNHRILEATGLKELHARGSRGKGVRIAIIDHDFRGWEKLAQQKKLGSAASFLDLTTERDPDLFPAPYPDKSEGTGHGTQVALAAALAAPDAELVLVRIDGFDPYQLVEIVRYIRGGLLSQSLVRRQEEVYSQRETLSRQREDLARVRRIILENFEDETDQFLQFGFLGPAYGWVFSDRYWLYQLQDYQTELESAWKERYYRFLKVAQDVKILQGVDLVVNSLGWHDGFPVGGASPLSRWFASQPAGKPLWFQSVGNTRSQAWTGVFRDDNGNGTLEFVPFGSKLPEARWSPEVHFLGFQSFSGERIPELPAPLKLRLAFQWREPHDPDYFTRSADDDPYLQPLVPIQLTLLRQRDPRTQTLPADLFEAAARSYGLPQRIDHQPGYSIYEVILEVPLAKAGRYAVRVDRQLDRQWILRVDPILKKPRLHLLKDLVSTGVRPVGAATLPELEKQWEMHARLFVDVIDDTTRAEGRVILLDYPTTQGTIGLPSDARGVISVGAADLLGRPKPYTAVGAPAFLDLAQKPDVLAYDDLRVVPENQTRAFGTHLANAFTAGWAASQLSAGMTAAQVQTRLRAKPGQVLGR